jgi:hypothetical protein
MIRAYEAVEEGGGGLEEPAAAAGVDGVDSVIAAAGLPEEGSLVSGSNVGSELPNVHEKADPEDVAPFSLHSTSRSTTSSTSSSSGKLHLNYASGAAHVVGATTAQLFITAPAASAVDEATGTSDVVTVVPRSPGDSGAAEASAAEVQALAEQYLAEFRRQAVQEQQHVQLQRFTGGFQRMQRGLGDSAVGVAGEGDVVTGRVLFTARDEYNMVLSGGNVLNASRVQCLQDMIVDGVYSAAPWLVFKVSVSGG